ncbi:MAG: transporter substrate-binding domain-containing protein [Gammaproteobacteria bacterium]|nr:transporter substrate-binding domain-containing protein [Gammaproteobacteria bacterium]
MRIWGSLVLGFGLCATASAATVSLRADVWFPMNGEPGSARPGFMVEIATAALKAGGHTVDYATMPWERTLMSVRQGQFDCAIGAYKEDAPDFVFPEEPQGMDQSFLWVKTDDAWKFNGLDSLKGRSVGLIGGYAYDEAFQKFVENAGNGVQVQTINADNGLEQNIKKLQAGRVNVVVESESVMKAKLADMGMSDQIRSAGTLTDPVPMYIACSPAKASSKEYARLLGEGVRQLRASGELKAILDKYGLKDWR